VAKTSRKERFRRLAFDLVAHALGAFLSSIASVFVFFVASIPLSSESLKSFLPLESVLRVVTRFVYVPVYVGLWAFSIYCATVAWRGLYGGEPAAPKSRILAHVIASVVTFVFGFATVYYDLSSVKRHFDTDQALSLMSAFYFSMVTFATVGYGDISPKSDIARFWVSIEIIGGLAYTVLIFSVVANFIRQPVPRDDRTDG